MVKAALAALILSGCSAYDYGLEPIKFSAGEGGRPTYATDDVSKVKSMLSGSPN